MESRTQYVRSGQIAAGKAPACYRSIVGPGYVVCVWTGAGIVGGLAHLGDSMITGVMEESRARKQMDSLVNEI